MSLALHFVYDLSSRLEMQIQGSSYPEECLLHFPVIFNGYLCYGRCVAIDANLPQYAAYVSIGYLNVHESRYLRQHFTERDLTLLP